jgi:sortase A
MPKVKGNGALRALEIVLMMVAVASLTAYGLIELEQYRGQASLRAEFEQGQPAIRKPAPEALPRELPGEIEPPAEQEPEQQPPPPAEEGTALGRLTSDRIGLDVMIAEGVDHATLRRAAGRIPGTARLDDDGNIGIAAHRDTFFRPLHEIRKGDVLAIETHRKRYEYEVEWTAVVEPENVRFLEPTTDAELTLVTCFPFYYVGPAPRRFIVRAKRLNDTPSEIANSAIRQDRD